jgi:hypothetical protein
VVDQRVADKVEIKRPTALFVDKSGSMSEAIEVAKQLAALIGAVINADFRVYAFDTAAFELSPPVAAATPPKVGLVEKVVATLRGGAPAEPPAAAPRRPTLSDWEQVFKFVKADGGTSIGAPLAKMTKERVMVEQIVLVTDEGENTQPYFGTAHAEYVAVLGVAPSVIIVHVGSPSTHFAVNLHRLGIEVTRYAFTGDYYSLPNVLPLLAMPSRAELVDLIMARPLPRRPAAVAS